MAGIEKKLNNVTSWCSVAKYVFSDMIKNPLVLFPFQSNVKVDFSFLLCLSGTGISPLLIYFVVS